MPLKLNMQNYKINEMRKHKRYKVKPGIFAVLGKEFNKLGKILDISMGGLAFSYAATKTRRVDSTEMIFLFDKIDVNINNLSYKFHTKIISEKNLTIHNSSGKNLKRIRCSLQFNNLPFHQKIWIETFLSNHTINEVGQKAFIIV